jgi:hypothetical protein
MSETTVNEIRAPQQPPLVAPTLAALEAMTPRQLSAACASSFNDEPELQRKYGEYVLAHSEELSRLIRAARS